MSPSQIMSCSIGVLLFALNAHGRAVPTEERIRRRLNTEAFAHTLSVTEPLLPINGADETLYDHAEHDEVVFLDAECARNASYAEYLRQRLIEEENECLIENPVMPLALPTDNYFYFYLKWNANNTEDCAAGITIDFEAFCISKIEYEPIFAPVGWSSTFMSMRSVNSFECETKSVSGAWFFDYFQGSDPTPGSYDSPNFAEDNVVVYVLDTFVNLEHEHFAHLADDEKENLDDATKSRRIEETQSHGTHVAGSIAGQLYGVMRSGVTLKACTICPTSSCSGVLIDYCLRAVIADLKAERAKDAKKRGVINMSVGGAGCTVEDVYDPLFREIKENGGVVVVAAGNEDDDSCSYQPACSTEAVTVGAYGENYERAYFSNYGRCVDAWSPGVSILSSIAGSNTAYGSMSGTSMASPLMAGMVGQLVNINNELTTEDIKSIVGEDKNGFDVSDCQSTVCNAYSVACEGLADVAMVSADNPSTPTSSPAPTAAPPKRRRRPSQRSQGQSSAQTAAAPRQTAVGSESVSQLMSLIAQHMNELLLFLLASNLVLLAYVCGACSGNRKSGYRSIYMSDAPTEAEKEADKEELL